MDTVEILGLRFFDGTAEQAVEQTCQHGGVVTVPAAPALVRLQHDAIYQRAMLAADLTLPDSGLMVLSWRILWHQNLRRVSGLAYLKALVRQDRFRQDVAKCFVLPSQRAKEKLLEWAGAANLPVEAQHCYIAPLYSIQVEDKALVAQIERTRPRHVVIAIGNGPQEKLGIYLREHLSYLPAIHCIGAALGFLTGDQVTIPVWADLFYLGWLFRLISQPRVFVPRLAKAAVLPWLIFRYGKKLPDNTK